MEFSQIKEQFSELERKEALKKAKLINNSILIRLASGEITSYACRRIYPEMERKYALKKAIIMKDQVLIELASEVVYDITGLETSLVKHKVMLNDIEYVRKVLKTKKLVVSSLNECIKIAIQNQNTDMIKELLYNGASKRTIMGTYFEMGQLENVILLLECGCNLEFDKNLKQIVDGCSSRYAEIINWLLEQMPDNSLNVQNFEKTMRFARIYGKDHIANHMKKCLEAYKEKFIMEEESESEQDSESKTESDDN